MKTYATQSALERVDATSQRRHDEHTARIAALESDQQQGKGFALGVRGAVALAGAAVAFGASLLAVIHPPA
jgi:hypothetical protein